MTQNGNFICDHVRHKLKVQLAKCIHAPVWSIINSQRSPHISKRQQTRFNTKGLQLQVQTKEDADLFFSWKRNLT